MMSIIRLLNALSAFLHKSWIEKGAECPAMKTSFSIGISYSVQTVLIHVLLALILTSVQVAMRCTILNNQMEYAL